MLDRGSRPALHGQLFSHALFPLLKSSHPSRFLPSLPPLYAPIVSALCPVDVVPSGGNCSAVSGVKKDWVRAGGLIIISPLNYLPLPLRGNVANPP